MAASKGNIEGKLKRSKTTANNLHQDIKSNSACCMELKEELSKRDMWMPQRIQKNGRQTLQVAAVPKLGLDGLYRSFLSSYCTAPHPPASQQTF